MLLKEELVLILGGLNSGILLYMGRSDQLAYMQSIFCADFNLFGSLQDDRIWTPFETKMMALIRLHRCWLHMF